METKIEITVKESGDTYAEITGHAGAVVDTLVAVAMSVLMESRRPEFSKEDLRATVLECAGMTFDLVWNEYENRETGETAK